MLTQNTKRYLVTGGSGFIGSAVVRHLLDQTNYHVLNIDKLTYSASHKTLISYKNHPRYLHQNIDICQLEPLKNLINLYQPDVVIHLAAESHVDNSINAPDPFIQTNVIGTYTLLKVALDYWQNNKNKIFRFHHVSTDEVYGSLSEDGFFCEDSAYAPNSPYSATKAASDLLVRSWHKTYGLPITMSNCSNNYGPYQFPEKLIPTMIIKALAAKPLPVYGNGKNIRDWLFVEDHVKALMCIIDRGKVGETYLIGGQTERRNLDLIFKICDILDRLCPRSSQQSYRQLIDFVPDRLGHDYRYATDITKISTELNWAPTTSFENGLTSTIQWYLDHQDWWSDLLQKMPSPQTIERLAI